MSKLRSLFVKPFGIDNEQVQSFVAMFLIEWLWIIILVSAAWIFVGLAWDWLALQLIHRVDRSSERRIHAASTLADFRTNATISKFWIDVLQRSRSWTGVTYRVPERPKDRGRKPVPVLLKSVAIHLVSSLTTPSTGALPGIFAFWIVSTQRGWSAGQFDILGWIRERPAAQISVAIAVAGLAVASISFVVAHSSPFTRGLSKWRIEQVSQDLAYLDNIRTGAIEIVKVIDRSIDDWHRLCMPRYGAPMRSDKFAEIWVEDPFSIERFDREFDLIADLAAKVPRPWSLLVDVRRSLPRDAWRYILELGIGDGPSVQMIRSRWSDEPTITSPLAPHDKVNLFTLANSVHSEANKLLRDLPGQAEHLHASNAAVSTTLKAVATAGLADDRRASIVSLRASVQEVEHAAYRTRPNWTDDDYKRSAEFARRLANLVAALDALDVMIRNSIGALCELRTLADACQRSLQQFLWPHSRLQRLLSRLS